MPARGGERHADADGRHHPRAIRLLMLGRAIDVGGGHRAQRRSRIEAARGHLLLEMDFRIHPRIAMRHLKVQPATRVAQSAADDGAGQAAAHTAEVDDERRRHRSSSATPAGANGASHTRARATNRSCSRIGPPRATPPPVTTSGTGSGWWRPVSTQVA